MFRPRTAAIALVAAVLTVSGCAGDSGDVGASGMKAHTDATSLGQPDRVIAGPQGRTPQFLVECMYSHSASDDPIVYPGKPGQSHLHEFFGNTEVNAFTTVGSLLSGGTTCDQPLDKAAYWAPALMRGPEVLTPVKSTAYYRPGEGVPPASVQPFPVGLVMIGGNSGATGEQPISIVAWGCGAGIERAVLPPECVEGRDLRLLVTFPDCWDGSHLDSADHHGHVAYSSGGVCPDGFAVPIPQLQFSVEYPVWGSTAGVALASGGLTTGHADFMNGWDQAKLTSEVELCLHREVVCGVASGRKTG
ncbi:MAG TPA: DUF1996 domain-containing protein [Ilumatobacteraceae bacterium]|nr:DUF1996 domain-containing protein [Ilumatobacteraceae bacterium]HRB03333.1 DUF1996 domain-containing protein [Ilumatobacteraceae bacterium]